MPNPDSGSCFSEIRRLEGNRGFRSRSALASCPMCSVLCGLAFICICIAMTSVTSKAELHLWAIVKPDPTHFLEITAKMMQEMKRANGQYPRDLSRVLKWHHRERYMRRMMGEHFLFRIATVGEDHFHIVSENDLGLQNWEITEADEEPRRIPAAPHEIARFKAHIIERITSTPFKEKRFWIQELARYRDTDVKLYLLDLYERLASVSPGQSCLRKFILFELEDWILQTGASDDLCLPVLDRALSAYLLPFWGSEKVCPQEEEMARDALPPPPETDDDCKARTEKIRMIRLFGALKQPAAIPLLKAIAETDPCPRESRMEIRDEVEEAVRAIQASSGTNG